VPSVFTEGWTSSNLTGYNYSGGWNSVFLSITGDGMGHPADLMDVNWIWLEVR